MVCRPKKPDHNTIKLKINNRRKTGKYFKKKSGNKTIHSSITNGSMKESKGKKKKKFFKILKQVETQHNKTYKMQQE